ncbi:tyrosine-protein phosphatase [Pseudonocardia spinosispora]|uniref:tyrosine-protein phosphatase n=1 Tax=Pseudonocardia spinosispora TaxID=103441 RepID=UPI000406D4B5|nr:tyrosine-protein phosphatase [Pseudonocardia spinosispora]
MSADIVNSGLVPDLLPNLRDLGGLRTDTGQRTLPGVLQRSAAPLAGDRNPDGVTWPPSLVVDLRGTDELGGVEHPLTGPNTVVKALPLLSRAVRGEDDSVVAFADIPDLATAYLRMLAEGGDKFATIVEWAARADGPVLLHCAAGKDRTGVVAALLLRAAGVSREEITEDYLRTETQLPAILARKTVGSLDQIDPTHAQRLMGVPVEAITAVLDEIDGPEGGAWEWLTARGATPEALRLWSDRLLGTG